MQHLVAGLRKMFAVVKWVRSQLCGGSKPTRQRREFGLRYKGLELYFRSETTYRRPRNP